MNNEVKIIDLLEKQGSLLNSHTEILEKQGESLEKVISLVLKQGEKIDGIESKIGNLITRDEYLTTQDQIVRSLINLTAEQAASVAREDRIETKLDLFRADYDSSTELIVDMLQGMEVKQENIELKVNDHERVLVQVKTKLKIA